MALAFTNTGDMYPFGKRNVFDLVQATWLRRYYADSGPLFALDTTPDIPVNCLYVQGDAKDFILPTPRAREPAPRGSGIVF